MVASIPPIATTGDATLSQISRSPSKPSGGALGSWVVPAEVDAVGSERDRRLDVVVDDERDGGVRAQLPERQALLDQLGGGEVFQAKLDERRAAVDRGARDIEVVDEGVQDHATLARSSRVAGSSA